MNENESPPAKRTYRWPWFLLAALLLGAGLAVLWVGMAARRISEMRESNPWPPVNAAPATQTDLLAGFREALTGGDAAAGRKIFFESPAASCSRCHKIAGLGGDLGPALDGESARRSREYVLEAILYPNRHVTTNFESVILLLHSGSGVSGILKHEDATNLVVFTTDEGLVTVRKSDVQLRQKGLSPMPDGLGLILSKTDLRDLVEFVASPK